MNVMEEGRMSASGAQQTGKPGLLRRLWARIAGLFEPEEVEVTFTQQGDKISYTYTKVQHHKQLA